MSVLKRDIIQLENGTLPITLKENDAIFIVDIDGVEWFSTVNQTHAIVLFNMMKEHITEYMHYQITEQNEVNLYEEVDEDLSNAVEEFYESCIRSGHYDMAENAAYFVKENNHITGINEELIYRMLQDLQEHDIDV